MFCSETGCTVLLSMCRDIDQASQGDQATTGPLKTFPLKPDDTDFFRYTSEDLKESQNQKAIILWPLLSLR